MSKTSSDPVLLWLWHRSVAAVLLPLQPENPNAKGVALKRQKKKKKKEKERKKKRTRKKQRKKTNKKPT